MGTDLALIEPPALPAASNPARMPSLPAWLQRRNDALANVVQRDLRTGQHREVVTLPQAMILNSSERAMVEQHVAALRPFLDLEQPIMLREKLLTNDQAHGVMVAALLMRGGAKPDKAMADALTEEYLDGIEDLPAWAVREAIRKWNRGESVPLDRKPHDFTFRPAPATLARLARIERWQVAGRIAGMQQLLDAQPLIEYSPEHRREMLGKLSTVMHSLEDSYAQRRADRMASAKMIGAEADALAEKAAAE